MRRAALSLLLAAVTALPTATIGSLAVPTAAAAANPAPTAPMPIRFEAGRHTGYTFNSSGTITGSRSMALSSASSAQTTQRAAIGNRGVFLRVSTGTLAGYWVRESIVAHVPGVVAQRTFHPARPITFPAGTVAGYRFDGEWQLVSAPILTRTASWTATASGLAVVDGTLYYRMVDGPLANSWVASAGSHTARRLDCVTQPRAGGGAAVWSQMTSATGEVALTFDMGGRTAPAMAIVKRLLLYGVCTTLFPTGDAAATAEGGAALEYADTFPAVFEFGNHTKDHCDFVNGGGDTGCPSARPSSSFVGSQLASAEATIESVTGMPVQPYWRPPYGSHDRDVRLAAAAAGYTKTVMWHIDTIDWRPPPPTDNGPTALQIVDKVVGGAGNGSIVLMHLGGWNTYAALPGMVNGLRNRGLTPTSISDLANGG